MQEERRDMSTFRRFQAKMSRRRFIRTMTFAGAGLAAACASMEPPGAPEPFRTPTIARALESPIVPGTGGQGQAAAETPQPQQEGAITLEQFLAFSSLLTGFDALDQELGRVYLRALQSGEDSASVLTAAYSAASAGSNTLPPDAEALAGAGFFEQQEMSDMAAQIAGMWYSGVYQQDGEDRVATYVDALAWKALHFTKPPTICGSYGFWATEPDVEISAAVQYTPAPTPAQEGQ